MELETSPCETLGLNVKDRESGAHFDAIRNWADRVHVASSSIPPMATKSSLPATAAQLQVARKIPEDVAWAINKRVGAALGIYDTIVSLGGLPHPIHNPLVSCLPFQLRMSAEVPPGDRR